MFCLLKRIDVQQHLRSRCLVSKKNIADDNYAIPRNLDSVHAEFIINIYNYIKEYKNIIKYSLFLMIKLGTWNIFLIVDLDC